MQGSSLLQKTIQTALRVVYPPRCLGCGETVGEDFGLCGMCRRDLHVIGGLVCETCGVPLPGEAGFGAHCDTCLAHPTPWHRGRAAILYEGLGRSIVLRLKHGDRTDIARGVPALMARAAGDVLHEDTVLVPVPLHWRRLAKRQYNQAALLAQQVSHRTGNICVPDALLRSGRHDSLDGLARAERFAALSGAISVNPARAPLLRDRPVLLIDDVMTSGATFAACTQALYTSQVREVSVLALARVAQTA